MNCASMGLPKPSVPVAVRASSNVVFTIFSVPRDGVSVPDCASSRPVARYAATDSTATTAAPIAASFVRLLRNDSFTEAQPGGFASRQADCSSCRYPGPDELAAWTDPGTLSIRRRLLDSDQGMIQPRSCARMRRNPAGPASAPASHSRLLQSLREPCLCKPAAPPRTWQLF